MPKPTLPVSVKRNLKRVLKYRILVFHPYTNSLVSWKSTYTLKDAKKLCTEASRLKVHGSKFTQVWRINPSEPDELMTYKDGGLVHEIS